MSGGLEKYEKLMDKIDDALHGQSIDDVVPLLLTFLATAGYLSGMEKKMFIAFVVEAIDRMYERAEQRGTDDEC